MLRKNYIKFINNSSLIIDQRKVFDEVINRKAGKINLINPQLIWESILGSVFDQFFETINAEVRIAVEGGIVNNKNNVYEEFYLRISHDKEWQSSFFASYPLFEKKCKDKLRGVITFFSRVLENINKDIDSLREFGFCSTNNLETIKFTSGDSHNHECTLLLIFGNDSKIYYKPKRLNTDIFVQKIINNHFEVWIGREIISKVTNLDRGEYGYCKPVEKKGCKSDLEVQNYFYNIGCLSTFCYLFGIEDLIFDNILTSQDKVVLIDLECILSPSKHFFETISLSKENRAFSYFSQSLFHSGILPRYNMTDSANFLANDSCMLLRNNNPTETTSAQNKHLPFINENYFDIKNHCSHFIRGFNESYKVLLNKKAELLQIAKDIESFDFYTRSIVRPTVHYSKMIHHLIHPVSLTSETEYQRSLNFIFNEEVDIFEPEIIAVEINEIEQLNVPTFYSSPTSKHLYNRSCNLLIKDYFKKTGIDLLIERIYGLSDDDLANQMKIIKNSLKIHSNFNDLTLSNNFKFVQSDVLDSSLTENAISHTKSHRILEEVNEIAQTVLRLNFDENNPGWIDINLNNFEMYEQSVLPPGLAHGTDGIAIFLGLAGSFCKNEKYTDIARKIIADNTTIFLNYKKFDYLYKLYTSPFIYPISSVYSALYLKDILCLDNKLVDRLIQAYFSFTTDYMHKTDSLCFLNGLAGNLNLLSSIFKFGYDGQSYNLARKIGDNLIKNCNLEANCASWKTKEGVFLGGYSHGSASFSNSFMILYDITKEQRFLDYAMYSLNFDRSTFNSLTGEFNDLRYNDLSKYSSSWAHGSSGIALSRIINYSFGLENDQEELLNCRKSMLKNNKGELHTLMNGFFGNLEILRALENQMLLPKRNYMHILDKILNSKSKKMSWKSALPWNHVSLSMFNGLCGIGYSLIRQSEWKKTPSVLCLELKDGLFIDKLHN